MPCSAVNELCLESVAQDVAKNFGTSANHAQTAEQTVDGFRDMLGDSLRKLQDVPEVSQQAFEDLDCPSRIINEPFDAAERRRFPRCPTFAQVSLTSWPAGADYNPAFAEALLDDSGIIGELMNLSRNGLAIVLPSKFVATELIAVRLLSTDFGLHYNTLCRVVRCKPLGDGRWQIVGRFAAEIPFELAYELCDHAPPSTTGIS